VAERIVQATKHVNEGNAVEKHAFLSKT